MKDLLLVSGIFRGVPVGLTFFREGQRMDSKAYSELVFGKMMKDLKRENGGNLDGVTWTQDGASCHRSREVFLQISVRN